MFYEPYVTLLLTPLKLERKYLMKALEKRGILTESFQISTGSKEFTAHRGKEVSFVLAEGGHGKTQFGIQTQFWIQNIESVKQIIVLGAAGALCPEIKPLDLIVVEKIIEHDYQQFFTPKAEKPEFQTSPLLLKNEDQFSFKIHRGILASGDEDIVSDQRAQALYEMTGAHAVAWESAGGIRSAQFSDIPYYEIRGITDNARDNVAEDLKKNLEIVMDQLGEFILPLISQ